MQRDREENDNIRIMQFNADRGKAATCLAEKLFIERFDVALLQEPYAKHKHLGDYNVHKVKNAAKSEIWTKKETKAITVLELTTANYVTVRIDDEFHITSIYDEPGGNSNRRLTELDRELGDRNGMRHIIGGDLNAHSEAWGNDQTDRRGEELLEWTIDKAYDIINDRDKGPTYITSRGSSYIDITVSKNVGVRDWNVEEEETLSGHQYVTYTALKAAHRKKERTVRDYENTDWEHLATSLKNKLDTTSLEEDVEKRAMQIQLICKQVCDKCIAKKQIDVKRGNEWWNNELGQLKRDTMDARRYWQLTRIDEDKTIYKEIKGKYRDAIKKAKEKHLLEELDDQIDTEPWHRAWRRVKTPSTTNPGTNIRREDGTYTNNEKEANQYLIDKYFPKDIEANDNERMARIRRSNRRYQEREEPQICSEEVAEIIRSLKKRKATAEDKIPNEAMPTIYEAIGEELLRLYQDCWAKGIFPKVWKRANLIWIPKKDGTPRPISLLPTLGKVLDRVVNRRLQSFLENNGQIDHRQYAYRRGTGTIEALKGYVRSWMSGKESKRHQLTIALDLSNAFNSAWRPYVAERLKLSGVSCELGKICESFLEDREIQTGEECVKMEKGCPQGSSLGPSLWNVVMQGWFQALDGANETWRNQQEGRQAEGGRNELVVAQAYADDQLVMVMGNSAREIERKWTYVWNECKRWEEESGSRYNLAKTEALFVEKDGKIIRPPVIRLEGQEVQIAASLKYLGVVFDRRLNFNEHIRAARRKSERLANKMVNLTRKEYGKNTRFIKIITDRVVAPAILYGCEIWGRKAGQAFNVRQMDAAQRPFLRAITKSYSTTPTAALQVLNGTPPWWVEALARYEEHWQNIDHITKSKLNRQRQIHIALANQLVRVPGCEGRNALRIYCDASVGIVVGFGYLEEKEGELRTERRFTEDTLDAEQAELMAVWLAIDRHKDEDCDITTYTDRLAVAKRFAEGKITCNTEVELWVQVKERRARGLSTRVAWVRRDNERLKQAHTQAKRAAQRHGEQVQLDGLTFKKKQKRREERKTMTIEKWQRQWNEGKTGRPLYQWCQQVGWDDLKCSFKMVQLLTGHGNMRDYLRRFRLAETDGMCECGHGSENVDHIRYSCRSANRVRAREEVRTAHGNLDVRLRRDNVLDREQLQKVCAWAEATMEEENYRGRDDEDTDEDEDEL